MGLAVDYVLENKKTGRLTFRRVFPERLRPYVPGGHREFKVPLGLKGEQGTLSRWEAAKARYETLLATAQRKATGAFDVLDAPTVAGLAEAFRIEALQQDEEARWSPEERNLHRNLAESLERADVGAANLWRGREGERWAAKTRETLEGAIPSYKLLRANGDLDGIVAEWREEALDLAEVRGLVIDPNASESIARLCRAMNDAAISAGEDRLRRLDGEEVATPPEPQLQVPARASEPQPVTVPIMATFDVYAKDMTAGVRADLRRNVARLVDFVGHDDAGRLTTSDIMEWRNFLAGEIGKSGKVRDPVTVKGKYVGAVKAMLNWAVQEQMLESNVAAPVHVKVPKKQKLREPDFTDEEARAILSASLEPITGQLSPGYVLARRWIPWLCAYTGGRVNEFSQMRREDVRQVEGIWTVLITPEAGTVKAKVAREVPLHPHLIEQGFLEMVASQKPGPLFYDPSQQRAPGEGNRHIKKVGERLAAWVRSEVGVDDPAIKPNHAWRHTFKTRATTAGMQERVLDAIQGHSPANVSRSYGHVPLAAKAAAINLLPRFEVKRGG